MTFRGSGDCQSCGVSLKPALGKALIQEHSNDQGLFCALHCPSCRAVEGTDW